MKSLAFIIFTAILLLPAKLSFGAPLPSDTSFTVYSAAQKLKNKFPNAVPVKTKISKKIRFSGNINYSTEGNFQLFLDLFAPAVKSKKPRPAIVLIHGGGWHSGDKTMEHPIAAFLAEKGFVAATVEYRMAMEFPFPAGIYDIKTSVRWLKANAAKYNIDTARIAVLGCSAGAEMATFTGVTNGMAEFEGTGNFNNYSSNVSAIINIDGIVDFMHVNSTKYDENPAKPCAANNWLGGSYKAIPAKWEKASPITYAGKNTPPVIFINSALEDYHAGRDEFADTLKKYGVYYEIHTIPETPHPFWLFNPWYEITCGYIYNFLQTVYIKQK